MAKIKIEIEFPEFVTAMLEECEYTTEQQVKILKAFTEGMLCVHNGIFLQNELSSFLDDIVDSGEEEDILNS
jgi:hypothetical protein